VIKVSITKDDRLLAAMTIVKINEHHGGELADYQVLMTVERGSGVFSGSNRALLDYPRNALNAVGLIKAALHLFDEETLGLEIDYDPDGDATVDIVTEIVPSNLAGQLRRAMRAISSGFDQLRDHGPAVRVEQQKQSGSDATGPGDGPQDRQ
jgi:hypothetical protein